MGPGIDAFCSPLNLIAHAEDEYFFLLFEKDTNTHIEKTAPGDLTKKPVDVGLKLLTKPFVDLLEEDAPCFHAV